VNIPKVFRVLSVGLLLGLAGGLWSGSPSPAQALDTSGIDWLRGLQGNRWYRIDYGDAGVEHVKWIFDSIINLARIQMDLEEEGGEFERALRRYVFYWDPGYEYWFPPYPDFEGGLGNPIEAEIEKQVRWPVWMKKKPIPPGKPWDEYYVIHLGRQLDDERDIYLKLKEGRLYNVKVIRWRYLPGVEGPPKVEELKFQFAEGEVELTRTYYHDNRSWEVYRQETLMVFGRGNPEPVSMGVEEPDLEIDGVLLLFDVPPEEEERFAPDKASQAFRGLIHLVRLQLGLSEDGGDLERYLRRDLFYYYPWDPWSEFVRVKHLPPAEEAQEGQERFLLEIRGGDRLRRLWISLSEAHGDPERGYEWGISKIKLERYLEEGTGPPRTELRLFLLARDRAVPVALYGRGVRNPDWTVAALEPLAAFERGNPTAIALTAELREELRAALEEELVSFEALLEGLADRDAAEELRLGALRQLREITVTKEINLTQQEHLVLTLFHIYEDFLEPEVLRYAATRLLKDLWSLKGRKVSMALVNQIKDRLSDILTVDAAGDLLTSNYVGLNQSMEMLADFITQFGAHLDTSYLEPLKDFLMLLFCRVDESNLAAQRIADALVSIAVWAFGEEIAEFFVKVAEGDESACEGR